VVRLLGVQRPQPDTLVALRAADAHGVLTYRELLACGLTPDAVKARVRAGRLHRVYRGVYAVGHPGLTQHGRWLAAVKACGPGALLSRHGAGMLYEFVPLEDWRPQVMVVGGIRASAGVRVHRSRSLHTLDRWRHRGIPVTSPARTLLDLAASLDDRPLRRAMSRAQALRLTSLRYLGQQIDRSHGRPGRARFARVLAAGPAPTRSELEDRVLDLLDAAGIARPHVNVPLLIEGRRVIPDFRWPDQRLCLEADGAAWHENPQARADDLERQALLEAYGERVIRVTWEQTLVNDAQTVARVVAAGAPTAAAAEAAPARPRAPRRSP
jgi:Transcriptional regulator, AbiEi antitoxin/Protein of unknown function (DUF559)